MSAHVGSVRRDPSLIGMSAARSCMELMDRVAAKMEAKGILPTTNGAAGKSGSSVLAAVGLTREDVMRITGRVENADTIAKAIERRAKAAIREKEIERRINRKVHLKYVPLFIRMRRWVNEGMPCPLQHVLNEFAAFSTVTRAGARSAVMKIFRSGAPSVEELDTVIAMLERGNG